MRTSLDALDGHHAFVFLNGTLSGRCLWADDITGEAEVRFTNRVAEAEEGYPPLPCDIHDPDQRVSISFGDGRTAEFPVWSPASYSFYGHVLLVPFECFPFSAKESVR